MNDRLQKTWLILGMFGEVMMYSYHDSSMGLCESLKKCKRIKILLGLSLARRDWLSKSNYESSLFTTWFTRWVAHYFEAELAFWLFILNSHLGFTRWTLSIIDLDDLLSWLYRRRCEIKLCKNSVYLCFAFCSLFVRSMCVII